MNCAHCRNLNRNFTGHLVKSCPVLASTKCRNCEQLGHTSRYCPNIPIAPCLPPSEPVSIPSFSWANAAKKAVTPKDEELAISLKQKEIADKKEKIRLDHEAFLERKAKREAIAKEKKERLMRSYELYCKHMYYEHGPGYLGCIRLADAPDCFYELIENDRYEAEKEEWEMERQLDKEIKAMEIAREAEKMEMKRKLPPAEYKEWKFNRTHDEIDEWLDEGFCQHSRDSYNNRYRQENAKIWLEEQLSLGHIVVGKDGKYKYYG